MRQTGTVYRFIKNKTLTVEVCVNAGVFMGLFGRRDIGVSYLCRPNEANFVTER